MKRLVKFGSIGLVIAGAIASVGEVGAQIPAVFRQLGTDGVVKTGISGTPNTVREVVASGGTPAVRRATTRINACGFTKITNPSAFTEGVLEVEETAGYAPLASFNVATVKASAAIIEPTCVNGVAAGIPATGSAFNVGKGAIVVIGLPTSRVLDLKYTSIDPVVRQVPINACGYGTFSVIAGGTISVDRATAVSQDGPYAGYSCSSGILSMRELSQYTVPAVPFPTLAAVSRDPSNNLIFKSTGSTSIPLSIAGQTFTRSATTDRCGGLSLGSATSPASGTVTINGTAINIDALPLRTGAETCTLSPQFGTYDNSQGYGSSRYANGKAYIQPSGGYGSRVILSVQTLGSRNATLTTNACGVAVFKSTTVSPLSDATSFTANGGTATTIGSLPLTGGIPTCNATRGQLTVLVTP